ncbi:hypothetical protein ACBQ07_21190 [Escherichia coli]
MQNICDSVNHKMPPAGGVVVPVVVPETSLPLIGWRSLWYTWGQKETGEWQWTFQVGDLENVNITHWAVMPKAPEAGA